MCTKETEQIKYDRYIKSNYLQNNNCSYLIH